MDRRLPREALNQSILDFSAPATGQRGFPVAYKISGLQPQILAAHPCTAGTAGQISGFLLETR